MADARGEVALVTGANKGIGFAIAQKLARLGMSVQVAARDSSRGEQAAARIRQEGMDAQYLKLDVWLAERTGFEPLRPLYIRNWCW